MRETISNFSFDIYFSLLPFVEIALLLMFLVVIPLGLFDKTKRFSGQTLFITSHLFGLALWLWTVGIAFGLAGWFWLILGLLIFGVGVSVVAFFAALFGGYGGVAFAIIIGWLIVFGFRYIGAYLLEKTERVTV